MVHNQTKMKSNKTLAKAVVYTIIYVLLFVIFAIFYMKDQLVDFIDKRTTITSKIVTTESLEPPTLILCMNPAWKQTVAEKYGLKESKEMLVQKVSNLTTKQKFEAFGYILNQDFEVFLNQVPLKEGQNIINPSDAFVFKNQEGERIFDVSAIRTHYDGICYKIEPKFEVKNLPWFFTLNVKTNEFLDEKDTLEDYALYLTSNNSWHGIMYQVWPQGSPTKTNIGFKSGDIRLKLTLTKSSYLKPELNTYECLKSTYESDANCSLVCDYLNNFPGVPGCETSEQIQCIFDTVPMGQIQNCFLLHQRLQYNVRLAKEQSFYKPNSTTIAINMESMTEEVKEEVQLISTQSFIGNLGGSLGMFFGFSIYGWFTFMVGYLIDKTMS